MLLTFYYHVSLKDSKSLLMQEQLMKSCYISWVCGWKRTNKLM